MVIARSRRRARERGAAVFIVVLIITLLTGIGLFAARSATLATTSSGYARQMTQTHYVTDYAMLTVISELSNGTADAHIERATKNPEPSCSVPSKVSNYTCERFSRTSVEAIRTTGGATPATLLNNTTGVFPGSLVPGSLGIGDLEADFNVEMTEIGPASPPVAGMDMTSAEGAKLKYKVLTLTATGMVRPRVASVATVGSDAGQAASIETQRAHLIVGPTK
jgi:hypothetical protein